MHFAVKRDKQQILIEQ